MAQDVHRHQLLHAVHRLKLLPSAPPGPPDLNGRTSHHKLLLTGAYIEEIESHALCVEHLELVCQGSSILQTRHSTHLTFEVPAAITDIQVTDLSSSPEGHHSGPGWVQIAAACSNGRLILGRMLVPRAPGAVPNDMTMAKLPLDVGGAVLLPQLQLHQGTITSVDVHPTSQAVLTAGADGGLGLVPADLAQEAILDPPDTRQGPLRMQPFKRAGVGAASYAAARWADTNVFATVGSPGSLQVWDTRLGPRPVLSAPRSWGPTGAAPLPWASPACTTSGGQPAQTGVTTPQDRVRQAASARPLAAPAGLLSLQVHPSRPNLCATGGAGGQVALWDLRMAAQPLLALSPAPSHLSHLAGAAAGPDVWEVRFDTLPAAAQLPTPTVLFCTSDGVLGSTAFQPPAPAPLGGAGAFSTGSVVGGTASLAQCALGLNSLDLEAGGAHGLVAAGDGGQLLYAVRQ